MDQLASMRIFLKVVDLGGLTPVANVERMSATMVGKHLRQLEERLGVRLLNRTTRRQSLTEAGQLYYDRCRHALAEVEAADASVSSMADAPRGVLRVSAAMLFGIHTLTPVINDYLARYPEMRVELHLNDRVVDLIEENMDVAIRVGTLPDSSLVARALRPYGLVVCASPAYLRKHGRPKVPDDLRRHNCLTFLGTWSQDAWPFAVEDQVQAVEVNGNLKVNSVHALRGAALDGAGIAYLPRMVIEGDLAAGNLVELLANHAAPERPLNVVYPSSRFMTPKLRTFVDCIVEHLGQPSAPRGRTKASAGAPAAPRRTSRSRSPR